MIGLIDNVNRGSGNNKSEIKIENGLVVYVLHRHQSDNNKSEIKIVISIVNLVLHCLQSKRRFGSNKIVISIVEFVLHILQRGWGYVEKVNVVLVLH